MRAHFSEIKVHERVLLYTVPLHAYDAHALGSQPVWPLPQGGMCSSKTVQRGQELVRRELLQLLLLQMQRRHQIRRERHVALALRRNGRGDG